MFQTFSGSSRRPRQVNLSGRNSLIRPGDGHGSQGALASAQQERLARQHDRERTQAATLVQKRWRGNVVRRSVREEQRKRWDKSEKKALFLEDANERRPQHQEALESTDSEDSENGYVEATAAYSDEEEALSQLNLLLRFMDTSHEEDFRRLRRYFHRLTKLTEAREGACVGGPWPLAYLRLEDTCLNALERGIPSEDRAVIMAILRFLTVRIPNETAGNSMHYYRALASIPEQEKIDLDSVAGPFQNISASTVTAYQGFAAEFLTLPNLSIRLGGEDALGRLAGRTNCKLLGRAVATLLGASTPSDSLPAHNPTLPDSTPDGFGYVTAMHSSLSSTRLLSQHDSPAILEAQRSRAHTSQIWLLGHIVYFYRHAYGFKNSQHYTSDKDFIFVVATLLSAVVDETEFENAEGEFDVEKSRNTRQSTEVVDRFIREQVLSLLNQESIGGLLTQLGPSSYDDVPSASNSDVSNGEHTRVLATYILTLLRMFPRRSDEIRMWLYLGLSSSSASEVKRPAVITYFWQAARNTRIYDAISADPRAAVDFLRTRPTSLQSIPDTAHGRSHAIRVLPSGNHQQVGLDDQWRVILIFIELYMFILKVMDDEEFFSSGKAGWSAHFGQKNTLPLDEIKALTTFLKHLGFAMYYYAREISGSNEEEHNPSIGSLFRAGSNTVPNSQIGVTESMPQNPHIAGLRGLSLDYVKGLVTGLIRAIYERDSRRPFLPRDHWLMTSRFDMSNFIDAVVEEDERCSRVQEEDDEDTAAGDEEDQDLNSDYRLVGTSHARNQQKIEERRRQQRKASRRRYLQAVAPRLEILQNMPFLIPFTTRVQIFRRFVHLDQTKRRHGAIEPEVWRMMEPQTTLQRHQAKIRRGREFEDAYDSFYELGAALKEPISITFVDKFDTIEAGIDGGGVTKEFLTSVTNQAFAPSDGINLFVENDQHVLYPNPAAVDEQKELLREAGFDENHVIFRTQVADLLQRYDFLGRIIGKCLYEGILIDVSFAGFFLLKWSLTGGNGSAPRESGYRANLNDLRDLDEGLYQGLLQLKNYPGDVEDFSLNFTVTDTIPNASSPGTTKTITRELKPGGSAIPVTNSNRLVYISYMARHRLSIQPYAQTTAFLRGLASIVQPTWLRMFNQGELQTLVGGAASPVSVADLRAHTVYGGVYTIGDDGREHASVALFWSVMQEFADEERRKVLKFVTSTPRAPLLGFAALNPAFSIRDAGPDESRLPSTSTCVNLLKLPLYSRKEVCREKLLQAINSGAGFDLS